MIVIVGSPVGRLETGRVVAAGLPARIAMAAAAAGRQVQIVGRIGDDAAADGVLQDLARSGVGHVAILRDPARATPVGGVSPDGTQPDDPPEIDGQDVELALRYLTDFRVIVLVEPAPRAVVDVVARASEWGGAALLVASPATASPATVPAADVPDRAVPDRAQVVRRGEPETEAAFAERVAALAVTLDVGVARPV